jgi:betaine-homocysteine S-methyltransferase
VGEDGPPDGRVLHDGDDPALGVRYLGVCCGAGPHHIRSLAEALGRRPPASRYTADMSKHILFGTDKRLNQKNLEDGRKIYGSVHATAP